MTVWVRLSRFPIEWMEVDLLWHIGGMLGSMRIVDPITESQAKGRFTRICVEIDVSQPLCGTLRIDGKRVRVEYKSMRLIYFNCGRISHGKKSCHEGLQSNQQEDSMVGVFWGLGLLKGDLMARMEGLITGDAGSMKQNTSNMENFDKHSGGVKKDKAAFKYIGTNSNNVGGSRFDILNHVAEETCKVTNLKEKTRPVKKTKKAKTSGSAGSKIKMQLAFNTSSENGSQSGKAGFFEENFQVDSIDKSQSI
ncbi:hypothetical protein ACOSQ2_022485 [Xanthoceras sorbifolium]